MIEIIANNLLILLGLTALFAVTGILLVELKNEKANRKKRINQAIYTAPDSVTINLKAEGKKKPSFERFGQYKGFFERWYNEYTLMLMRAGMKDKLTLLPFLLMVAWLSFFLAGDIFSAWMGDYLMVYSPLLGFLVPYLLVRYAIRRRMEKITELLPGSLESFSRILHVGGTPERGLSTLAQDAEKPLDEIFRDIIHLIEIGMPFEDALHLTAKKLNHTDFSFFAATLIIQRKSGGSITETIDHVIEVLHRRKELRLKMKALMADSNISTLIVTLIPVVMFAYVVFVSDEYRTFYFMTDHGKRVLFYIVIFLFIGNMVVRRMARLKV